MMIASQSTPTFSPSFTSTPNDFTPLTRSPFLSFTRFSRTQTRSSTRRLTVSSRLNSSKSSGAGGSVNNGDAPYELHHDFSPQRRRKGSTVFVTLPVNCVGREGNVWRPKTMMMSLKALAAVGVEGVVVEIWWGLVERDEPRVYNWKGYRELVMMACMCGLKVRAVLAFHQFGTGPGDPNWYAC